MDIRNWIEKESKQIGRRYGNFEFSDHAGQQGHDNLVKRVNESLTALVAEIERGVQGLEKQEYYSDRGLHEMSGYNKAIKNVLALLRPSEPKGEEKP